MGWERRGLRHLLISQTPLSLSTRLSTRLPPSSLYLLASIFSLPPHAGWVISTFSLCRLQSDQNPPGPPLCRLRPDPPQRAVTMHRHGRHRPRLAPSSNSLSLSLRFSQINPKPSTCGRYRLKGNSLLLFSSCHKYYIDFAWCLTQILKLQTLSYCLLMREIVKV